MAITELAARVLANEFERQRSIGSFGNNHLPSEKAQMVNALLQTPGYSVRRISAELRVAKHTVTRYRRFIETRPPCPCGNPAGDHKGWCRWRFERSPSRQAWIKTVTQPDPMTPIRQAARGWLKSLYARANKERRIAASLVSRWRSGSPCVGTFIPEECRTFVGPRIGTCSETGCPFPAVAEGGKCRRHAHFFDYTESMEWCGVGHSDTHATEDSPHPLFSTMQAWELSKSADRVISDDPNTRAREKLSEDWWLANVVNNRPASTIYKPETPTQNIQHTGAFVLWKGFGRRKIRKSQRRRPAGWHGNHPEQMPIKRYSRKTIEDLLPQLSPHGEPIEDQAELMEDYTLLAEPQDWKVGGEGAER